MYGDALDLEIIAQVEAIAAEHNASMAEVALAWLYSKDDICCPIIGASSISQLENNAGALEIELSGGEIQLLNEMYKPRDVINDHVPNPIPRYLEKN